MNTLATIILENNSEIKIELFDKDAPNTVKNFVKLAEEKFYDGLTFHRVVPSFVVQTGCPFGTGHGNAGYTIKCETEGNPNIHDRGVLSMAHAGRDTGSSQFFITLEPQPHLDGVHTVFGKVTEGMEFVDQIKQGDKIKTIEIH